LGIFADGLASFASDSSEDGSATESDDEEEATAGMELTLMGVQTRPLVFFVGKGELMGLVWSGAGSERTSAIQVTFITFSDGDGTAFTRIYKLSIIYMHWSNKRYVDASGERAAPRRKTCHPIV
jgi:hypothetical protein